MLLQQTRCEKMEDFGLRLRNAKDNLDGCIIRDTATCSPAIMKPSIKLQKNATKLGATWPTSWTKKRTSGSSQS